MIYSRFKRGSAANFGLKFILYWSKCERRFKVPAYLLKGTFNHVFSFFCKASCFPSFLRYPTSYGCRFLFSLCSRKISRQPRPFRKCLPFSCPWCHLFPLSSIPWRHQHVFFLYSSSKLDSDFLKRWSQRRELTKLCDVCTSCFFEFLT